MDRLLLVLCLGATSLASYGLGRKVFGLDRVRLASAVGNVLECLGVSILFLAANVSSGGSVPSPCGA